MVAMALTNEPPKHCESDATAPPIQVCAIVLVRSTRLIFNTIPIFPSFGIMSQSLQRFLRDIHCVLMACVFNCNQRHE